MGMEFAIRVTDRCNLCCAYCYARVNNPKDMTVEVLSRVLEEVVKFAGDSITISWTGGEPLILGHKFFSCLESVLAKLGTDKFTNILQSNLILLDDWFVNFLARNAFFVRTSLDLPPENHELLRRSGNFVKTLRSIEKLKAAGVPVNVNTVITEHNVNNPEEIFKFLKNIGITSFSVSRLVEQGNAIQHPELAVYDNAAFGYFLVRLFDLWVNDKVEPLIERITPLDKLLTACQRGTRDESAKCFHCQSQMFAIGPDGSVFPSCNKFFALPKTCLGRLDSVNLTDILNSQERRIFLANAGDVSSRVCGKCEFVDYCEGGCYYIAYNARVKGEDMNTREKFCKGYYLVFKRIFDYLGKEVTNVVQ